MPMAVNLSLLSGPVVVFDTVHKIACHDTDANNFYKDKSFKQYKGRHSMGWNLRFPFI